MDLALSGCLGGAGGNDCDNGVITKVYINNGTSFVENQTWGQNLTDVGESSLTWGDINNDGKLDLALIGCTSATSSEGCIGTKIAKIYTNNGTSLLENSTWQSNLTAVYKGAIALGDLDNDGKLDVILIGTTDTTRVTKIYTNNGTSLLENSTWQSNLTAVYWGNIAFGDIDNDNDLDLALLGRDSNNNDHFKIYTNNGTSLLENSTWQINLTETSVGSLSWGDYDNDEDLDLVEMGIGDYLRIFENTDSTLRMNQSDVAGGQEGNLVGVYWGSLGWGDYDNDGDLDLVATGAESGRNRVYENNETNNYFFTVDNIAGANVKDDDIEQNSLSWADLDNDGDLDLIVIGTNITGGILARVYINNITTPNTQPISPNSSFSSSYANEKLTLSWGNGSDSETPTAGLYYNLRVGTVSGGNDTVSGVYGGGDDNGYFGNMMQRKSISLAIPNLQANTTYYWSVQTIDTALAKSSWSTEQNYTTPVDILNPVITINSPIDMYGIPNYTVTFNATVSDNSDLTNVSLYGNWSNWHLNETNSSGINNTDYIFTKNLTSYGEGTYAWYIKACDSANNCAYSANRTFIIDLTYPIITLISPSNASTWSSSSTVTFQYNVSDIIIANCSLIINNAITENDTSIAINTTQTFTKSLSNAVYNWSINCTDYSNYKNSSETRELTVSYSAPSGNGGGGGGGGGAGTTTPTALKTFSLDKTSISSLITQGEITNKTITIENTGKVNLTINIEVQGIDAIISEKTFTIAPKQSKTIDIHLIAPLTKEPGIYTGKIIISSDVTTKIIPVVLEIKEKEALFDIKITIPEKFKNVFPGDEITAEIQLTNLGKIGKVDIKIKYYITDKDNKTITSASDTLAVETVTSFIRTLTIPKDTLLGDYFFNVDIIYEDIIRVSGNAPFNVIAKQPFLKQYLNWFIIGTIIIISLTILIIYLIKQGKIKKKILTEEKKIERREKKLEKEVEKLKRKRKF